MNGRHAQLYKLSDKSLARVLQFLARDVPGRCQSVLLVVGCLYDVASFAVAGGAYRA